MAKRPMRKTTHPTRQQPGFLLPGTKDTNPKDVIGAMKAPLSTVPGGVLLDLGLGMLEGIKYGRHNYRIYGVKSSVYYDAAMRHLIAWWEGEDVDPDSGLSHITKAMSSLAVLRDAQMNDMVNDDRPPRMGSIVPGASKMAAAIIARIPEPKAPYTQKTNPSRRKNGAR